MEHIPLPWFIATTTKGELGTGTLVIAGDSKYKQTGLEYDGNVICAVSPAHRTTEIDAANAVYILTACNNHYKLKTQLERLEAIARDTIGADVALIMACDNAKEVLKDL